MTTRSAEAIGTHIDSVKPIVSTDVLDSPAVGEGTDVRFETDRITGSALLREGRVVHAEVPRVN